jgi:hypothetical protein
MRALLIAVTLAAALWFAGPSDEEASSWLDNPPQTFAPDRPSVLFDSQKVLEANLRSGQAVNRTAVVIWQGHVPADLNRFLRPGTPPESVTWRANGALVVNGQLDLGRKPDDNRVRTVLIAAKDAVHAEEVFALVIVPPSTPRKFADWLRHERENMAWVQSLPPIYARLGPNNSNPEPETCRPRFWPTLRRIDTHYHPGAAYEMRSVIRPDDSGHQATYASSGELLCTGVSAGSADRSAPGYSLFRLIHHIQRDVTPYLWAAQLDGNPVNPAWFYMNFDRPLMRQGEHLQSYQEVRPVYGLSHREVIPGHCIEGPAP